MSYISARFKKKKPPPNPIIVGCGGTLFLALLYGVSYALMQYVLNPRIEQTRPSYLRPLLAIPQVWEIRNFGLVLNVPLTDGFILWVEITLIVMLLLGLSMTVYSFYYGATREKEAWELYAEEAERQARMSKHR
jgi:hypothetical protein